MSIVGRTYLERGEPVEIVVQWKSTGVKSPGLAACPVCGAFVWGGAGYHRVTIFCDHGDRRLHEGVKVLRGGPRNVLIRRTDGSEVVRPFRGLRKGPETPG